MSRDAKEDFAKVLGASAEYLMNAGWMRCKETNRWYKACGSTKVDILQAVGMQRFDDFHPSLEQEVRGVLERIHELIAAAKSQGKDVDERTTITHALGQFGNAQKWSPETYAKALKIAGIKVSEEA